MATFSRVVTWHATCLSCWKGASAQGRRPKPLSQPLSPSNRKMPCDGCGRQYIEDADDDDIELELETCEDCGWSVCEDCSCNERLGVCKCVNSNMGNAYCDMEGPKWYMGSNGGARYTGPFKCNAQINAEAQLMMDRCSGGAWLTECSFHECGKVLSPESAKLCTRCRSAIYCSVACQRAAWSAPHGVHGTHKQQCGVYLPPEDMPYISRDFLAYHEHWGRYPTAKPTAAQRTADEERAFEAATVEAADGRACRAPASTMSVTALHRRLNAARDAIGEGSDEELEGTAHDDQMDEVAHDEEADEEADEERDEERDEALRRAYLDERDAMLMHAGLGELISMPPPTRPATKPSGLPGVEGWQDATGAARVEEQADAAGRAASLLGVGPGTMGEDEEEDEDAPMSQAEASARARAILDKARLDFGRC